MSDDPQTRRSFLSLATTAGFGAAGLVAIGGLVRSCAPDAKTLGEESTRRISLPEAPDNTVIYAGRLFLLKVLSADDIHSLRALPVPTRDPWIHRINPRAPKVAATADNIFSGVDKTLLVLSLMCPNAGCVVTPDAGDHSDLGGFHCICRGSHFDGLGRITRGPSTRNMMIPTTEPGPDGTLTILDHDHWMAAR